MPLYKHPHDGVLEDYPFGKELAIKEGSDRYLVADYCDDEQCYDPGVYTTRGRIAGCYQRFTANDRCVSCASRERDAIRKYFSESKEGWDFNEWTVKVMSNKPAFTPSVDLTNLILELSTLEQQITISDAHCKKGHPKIVVGKKCYICDQERSKLSPRQEAINNGETWYLPTEPCSKCGTLSYKRVNNGSCRGCETSASSSNSKSPRQVAKAAGDQWYFPLEACGGCGKKAPKRVCNSECSGCTGTTPRDNWIISTVPCGSCGEVSKRHVSTGICFSCGSGGWEND